jgi:hypothetical protein
MRPYGYLIAVIISFLVGGCSAYTNQPNTVHLPTSNQDIDVVLHRSDVRFLDCATLVVIQTYNKEGLIDSKEARGRALHCEVIQAGIEAGGRVGAGAVLRPSRTTNNNQNSNSQAQGQGQFQGQGQTQKQTANGGQGGQGGNGGQGGQGGQGGNGGGPGGDGGHGNNGFGNGGGDGSNGGFQDGNR